MSKQVRVAVCGATGAVGNQIIRCLEERNFPLCELRLIASDKSRDRKLLFRGEQIKVQVLSRHSFRDIDIVLFSAGGYISKLWAPVAVSDGAVVIDNSSTWRMDPEVPLIVPEVNPYQIVMYKRKGIIANPNCSTIQMVVVLKPIHDLVSIKRVVVATYQAVSGTGQKAIFELFNQIKSWCDNSYIENNIYPYPIIFNLFPHIDIFEDNGYSREEMKIVLETQKIMNDKTIKVTATCVRVPIINCHSESLNITTEKKVDFREIREILVNASGVKVLDDLENNKYPMPLNAFGQDLVLVGRIRQDISQEFGIDLWITADNIRKGAATNAVQIAELLVKNYL